MMLAAVAAIAGMVEPRRLARSDEAQCHGLAAMANWNRQTATQQRQNRPKDCFGCGAPPTHGPNCEYCGRAA